MCWLALAAVLSTSPRASAQEGQGSIRGVVYDQDFDVPLAGAQVTAVELARTVSTGDQGNFVFPTVAPGKYTLVFTKDGYVRQVKADVLVVAGQLTDVDAELAGEFTEMDEFVVQDLGPLAAGSETALLALRFDSPALMDSIGSELMSRAGASDAAAALRLVAGATVQDGKYAVVRGLPDRYVSSQLNGVRLPTADEDKRAVELDQFPAAAIDSIQVSKTFTPDQQGDASGGAVNVKLKGIPDEFLFQLKTQVEYDTQASGNSRFLTYEDGGLSFLGDDEVDIQTENLGGNWDGAVGTQRDDAPINSKHSLAIGGKHLFDDEVKIGGYASFFYERDSSYYDDGRDDSYWVVTPGAGLTPTTSQGTPDKGTFFTSLYDITSAAQSVQWGALGGFGIETTNHAVDLAYLFTRTAEDRATLATDTRGKARFFPGYTPDDPMAPGNDSSGIDEAPYLRLETLEYTERTVDSLQLSGRHEFPFDEFVLGDALTFRSVEVDWTLSASSASLYQPDKRQFGALWLPASFNPGFPPFVPPSISDPVWLPYKPAANFNLGNLQRIWKEIDEDSKQAAFDVEMPFEQWEEQEGYLKVGFFADRVERDFNQDTFSNFGDSGISYQADWDEPWSEVFPFEDHPITASNADVDYRGDQDITAAYGMFDLPLLPKLKAIGGVRFESTSISIENAPEGDALWYPDGASTGQSLDGDEADVSFEQDDVLPAIGLELQPFDLVTLRAAYSHTVARQTFKELTPILQQEYLGGPVFIGNPDLRMSEVRNYDLRCDYTPFAGGLISLSWFQKDLKDPIENVQRIAEFDYTTAVNYPEGTLDGYEIEVRQDLGHFFDDLEGLSVGVNATFIDSVVTLPEGDADGFSEPGIEAPLSRRDMTNAPEHLYNFYVTYDIPETGTQLALFYTIQGDTLVAGAGEADGNFIPSVYAKEFGTLNASVSQQFGKFFKLQLQAKNLTDPQIEEVYRSEYIGDDVTKTSYSRGMEFSIGLSVSL